MKLNLCVIAALSMFPIFLSFNSFSEDFNTMPQASDSDKSNLFVEELKRDIAFNSPHHMVECVSHQISNNPIIYSCIDLQMAGAGLGLEIVRNFKNGVSINGPFGYGWAYNFTINLERLSNNEIVSHGAAIENLHFKVASDGSYNSVPNNNKFGIKVNQDGSMVLEIRHGNKYRFNNAGIMQSIQDRNGNSFAFIYDTIGRLSAINKNAIQALSICYGANNKIVKIIDNFGLGVEYAYDENMDLVTFKNVSGLQTKYSYDKKHFLTSITEPTGFSRSYYYDSKNRIKKILSNEGAFSNYEFNDNSDYVIITDAIGNKSKYGYNSCGLIENLTDPLDRITSFSYNEESNLTQIKGPLGNTYSFSYDNYGNIVRATDPLGYITQYAYSISDFLTSITSSSGEVIRFNYDSAGNQVAIQYPDSSKEEFKYDKFGNMISKTDRMNHTISTSFDSLGSILTIALYDGTAKRFSYNKTGTVLSAKDGNGAITFGYDSLRQLIHISYPQKENVSYVYDQFGRRASIEYPDGTKLNYVYDKASRLTWVESGGSAIVNYLYDLKGRPVRRTLQNGFCAEYAYDAAGELTNIIHRNSKGDTIEQIVYTYDPTGNRTSESTLSGAKTFQYDAINQLIGVTNQGGIVTSYEYDDEGNRKETFENNKASTYLTNKLNQYISIDNNLYSYDGNGNLTAKSTPAGKTQYLYNLLNQLVEVIGPSGKVFFSYDPFGRRISKTTSQGTIFYIYDGHRVIMEKDGKGRIIAKYIYGIGIDEVIETISNSGSFYCNHDGLGSVINLSDKNGKVIEKYTYGEYGSINLKSNICNSHLFTGREFDKETGLYYYRARYYDPEIGRFLTPDPAKFKAGINLYQYAHNNPVNRTDPLGLYDNNQYIDAWSQGNNSSVISTLLDQATGYSTITSFLGHATGYDKLEEPLIETIKISAEILEHPITGIVLDNLIGSFAIPVEALLYVLKPTNQSYNEMDFFNQPIKEQETVDKKSSNIFAEAVSNSRLAQVSQLNGGNLPPPPPPGGDVETVDIQDGVDNDKIDVKAKGTGDRSSLDLSIKNKSDKKGLLVGVSAGTTFKASSLNVQNMAIK